MKVVFSPLSERDLEEIGDFIAADNPRRAVSFIQEMRDRCQKISSAPEAAPLRDGLIPGVRMVAHGNFLIFLQNWRPRDTDRAHSPRGAKHSGFAKITFGD